MGVAISELLPRKAISLDDLAGKKIAVDAFNALFLFLAMIRDRLTGEPLTDRRGNVTSHLCGLLYRTLRWLEAGIRPVFVFNGRYPAFKQRTIEVRRARRAQAQRQWKEAVKLGKPALKLARAATRMETGILESAKKLLDLMGMPWIQAPSEGEAQCAWMSSQGIVFATASQDLDSLLFGSPRLVRSLWASDQPERRGQEACAAVDPELIDLAEVLQSLGLTREQLIVVGLLVGTDYNEGVKGIGPGTAVKLVKAEQTLENVLAKVEFPLGAALKKIYDFFLNPPHTDQFELVWKPPEEKKLRRFLVEEHDFAQERVETAVRRLQEVSRKVTVGG
jgi:flap endonuclease-1